MLHQVFAITGNKISSMLTGEMSLMFSSQSFDSAEEFQAAWDKKLSLATKVEAKYNAIKSVHKDDDSADILIKYKTFLGIPTNCQFSFHNDAAYPVFFSFLEKERYFTKQEEKLTPLKSITNYLICLVATLAFTVFCYSEATRIANGTVAEATNGKQELFNDIMGALGEKGVLAAGALLVAFLGYKAWMRFINPPNRLLFLPPSS
jgi:TRAP-type mannitol/chloroaromatic compound transport system substrate-binding protein